MSNLVDDVLQLDDGHADQPVVPGEAVVSDADMQLVAVERLLVTDHAAGRETEPGQSRQGGVTQER